MVVFMVLQQAILTLVSGSVGWSFGWIQDKFQKQTNAHSQASKHKVRAIADDS